MDITTLSSLQLDALREAGNIGAGHAATALSKLLRQRIAMAVPRASVMPLSQVDVMIGGPDTPVWAIYLRIEGQLSGHMLFMLPYEHATHLVDMVMGRPLGQTPEIDEMGTSILGEVGNVLTSNYLVALGNLTKLEMRVSIPHLAADMAGAVLDAVIAELAVASDRVVALETELSAENGSPLKGYMFMLPKPESLEALLGSMGMMGR
jgi:chemotaxis protein CheC